MPNSLIPRKAAGYCRMAAGLAHVAAGEIAAIDENDIGTDDTIALGIDYGADFLMALAKGEPLPQPPDALLKLMTKKIISSPMTSDISKG
jgi:hypothetical protein